ncbi:hypothetical protein SDRG_09335 [Saprolegnia diclina VS20]|uniref:Helicase-associated domain-containing protein n=1 Tax=Saprolegnia diclina (strain VS20) TaxID=1156394 RepID=T0QDH1_SAPDV|nr:hypothetical protein SDRG_09335 [Saprolegnia diclina VS20]EQC32796.1 hypothetical protein SDRG_09335 [Saprolegnia diclina VS20]|eukprot:XP_008613482.1 hypothetical protein SDRG_09335 [Saprolegnia diclina VS20]
MQRLADELPAHSSVSFDVPAEPPWPQDLWDVDLLQLSAKRDAWLAEMAIQYSASLALLQVLSIEPPAVTFNKVYPVQLVLQCIEVYQALHGQAFIPLLFHVPLRDAKWPQDVSLMPLGFFVRAAQDQWANLDPLDQWANLDPLVRNAISAFGLSPDDEMDDVGAIDNGDLIDGDVGAEVNNDQDMAASEPVAMSAVPAGADSMDARNEEVALRQVYRPAPPPIVDDGFDWPLLLGALSWYFVVQKHSNIPSAYVMEGKVPLGDLVRQIRQGHVDARVSRLLTRSTSHARTHFQLAPQPSQDVLYEPGRFAELEALGFDWLPHRGTLRILTYNDCGARRIRNAPLTALVAALQAYHSTYGHLDIPKDFKVPAQDAAWPPDAANVALVYVPQTLHALFYKLSDNDVTVLHGLGLFSELPPWADARSLLSTFKNLVQPNTVPLDFAVPATPDWPTQYHGFGLGELAWYLGFKNATLPSDKRKQLLALGMDFNTPATWAGIVGRLEAGGADVPADDGVADDGVSPLRLNYWTSKLRQAQSLHLLPKATMDAVSAIDARNLTATARLAPLGSATAALMPSKRRASPTQNDGRCKRARVAGMQVGESTRTAALLTRNQKSILDELGVDGNEPSLHDEETDNAPPGSSPVVSDEEEFSSADDESSSSDDDESSSSASSSAVDDPPFVGRAAGRKHRLTWTWEAKIDALSAYRAECGRVEMPTAFRVPASSAYPPHLHDMALGKIVGRIRCGDCVMTPSRLRDLDALGFRWRAGRMGCRYETCQVSPTRADHRTPRFVSWSDQIDALLTYRRLHGNLEIPFGFIVPSTAEWPTAMHDVHLTHVLPMLRKHVYELPDHYTERVHGLELGLLPDIPNFDAFLRLVKIYSDTFGSGAVARDFLIPPNGGNWIDAWRGLCLGDLAWSVGLNMTALTAHKRALLTTVGFVFNSAETWRRIVVGLRTYHLVHNRVSVPTAFVVPSAPEWPADLHDMRLGHWVDVMTSARRYRLLPAATVAAIDAIGSREQANGALVPPPTSRGHRGAWPAPPTCSGAALPTAAAHVRATSPSPPVAMFPPIVTHNDDVNRAFVPSAPVVPSVRTRADSVSQVRVDPRPAVESSVLPPSSPAAAISSISRSSQEAPPSNSPGARVLVGAPPPVSGIALAAAGLAPVGKDGDSDDDNFSVLNFDADDDDMSHIDFGTDDNEESDREADASLELSMPKAAISGSRGESAAPMSVCIGAARSAPVESDAPPPHSSGATVPTGLRVCQAPLPTGASQPGAIALPASRLQSPEPEARVDGQWASNFTGLETFKAIYHHLDVPPDFVIQAMEPWPASVHGLQLGGVVMSLRLLTPTSLAPWIVARLDAFGFEWAPLCFDSVDSAMQRLADEHPAHPPVSFDVPAQPPWPQDLWDVDLLQLSDKRDAWLAEMAIQYSASLALLQVPSIEPPAVTFNKVYPVQLVLQCIEVHQALHGQALIPLLFHVPLRDAKWPQDASLMPLGYFVRAAQDQWANLDPLVRNAISAFGLSPDDGMDDVGAEDNNDAIDGDNERHAGPVIIDLSDDSSDPLVIDLSNDSSAEDDQDDGHAVMDAAPAAVVV